MRKALIAAAAFQSAIALPAHAQTGETIIAPGPQGDLAGTLVLPDQAKALVLIIPGSGPTDRDGNNPLGITAAPYRLLAEGLAAQNVGSLRIDKRGMFGSKAAVADANAVTIADYAADVSTWVSRLREIEDDTCLYLLGHSEGAIVALEAAQEVDDLCGVILLGAPGRPLGTVLRDQLRANPANGPILADAFAVIDQLEQGKAVDVSAMHPALKQLFAPQVQPFVMDVMRRDPADLVANVAVPVLIVQGGRDLQTPVADGEALSAAQPDAHFALLGRMTHVLKDVESDNQQANLATYSDSSLPLSENLIPIIMEVIDLE